MRMKLMALAAALLIQLFSAGCSLDKGNEAIPAAGGQNVSTGTVDNEAGSSANTSASVPADTDSFDSVSYENMSVVIDSVVDVFRESSIKSERVTQAIYNQPVEILEEKEGWMKVKVVDGYTGWIKSKYLDRDCASIKAADYGFRLVVTALTKNICSSPGGAPLKEVVMGTELYVKKADDNWYEVALPENKSGWVSRNGTIQVPVNASIPKTSINDFLATASLFKGITYLWGGISVLGVDCSGLTYICGRINGISLPRDADQQFLAGKEVSVDEAGPGDLVFFSKDEDLAGISHVGIYIDNGQFIHASSTKGQVIISPLSENYYKKRLVGVRRVF